MSPSERARERRLLNELSRINNEYGTQQRRAMQDLARSRRELTQARSALGAVAHDLRTPLQAVMGFSEFLLDEDLDPQQRDLVERIRRAAEQMVELADELLETVAATTPALRLAPVDLAHLVSETVTRQRLLGPERNVAVHAEFAIPAGTRPRVLGDAPRLERVLENLVSNAVKFSPAGGVVTIRLTLDGDEVELSVTDQGPGIAPADQEAVFAPFHRTAEATGVPGTGLGLTIVRKLVELHGGTVEVRSELGHGACFTVRLPRLTG